MALTVLKVGGSLSSEPKKLRCLMARLAEIAKTHRLVVVPGGGDFADTVRRLDKQFTLDRHVSHRMAILAMDQYGLLLSDLSTGSVVVRQFDQALAACDSGNLAIFLPSRFMFEEDPLENSWAVTSDSIALCIALRLGAERVLFVTDVDGVYTANPKNEKNAQLLKEVSIEALADLKMRTSIDSVVPRLLKKWPIECVVVNGFYSERVERLLDGTDAVSTLISAGKP
ncbi:hypothetical protein GX563_06430 [Candidatus Bathyarchaeota archaeon]|nr:hypothetical protein [Candidatus Bathyarchaeota archaeon]